MSKKLDVKRILTFGYSYYLVPNHVDMGDLMYALAQVLPCDYHGTIQEGELEITARSIMQVVEVADDEEEPTDEPS